MLPSLLQSIFNDLRIRLRSIFRRTAVEAELNEELRFHLEREIEKYERTGIPHEQAVRRARLAFGGDEQIKGICREARGTGLWETTVNDLRYALRTMRKSPGFTATAVLMLAFGIGATTAIFSIVDGVLLQPLPFPDAGRLVALGDMVNGQHWSDPVIVTPPEVLAYQRGTSSFESLGGYTYETYELSEVSQPAHVQAARMTPSVFSALGVVPLLGRVFTHQEDEQKAQVVVLSYAAWKNRFNSNPHVIGTTIDLDRTPYTVIGVMPRNFQFPLFAGSSRLSELWVPMSFTAQELSPQAQGSWYMLMIGRLKPGVTMAQAQEDAGLVAAQIMRNYPPDLPPAHFQPIVSPLHAVTVDYYRPQLRIFFLAVAVVLLIACANFAGLLLVRAIRRQRETAVRLALGAPAKRLLRQTIAESLVLSMAGGLLGIGLAAFSIYAGRYLLLDNLPLISQITLNWPVAGFAFLLALVTGVLCGLAPGFAALRTNVNASLKEGSRSGSAGSSHTRLRSALVVMEIAIALVLLCASGLLLRSYMKLGDVNLGFQPAHMISTLYGLPQKEYPKQAQVDAFDNQVLLRLRQLPGVQAVSLTNTIPIKSGAGNEPFVAEGYVNPRGAAAASAGVIGDFFKAMGIPLIRGRYFTDSDNANGQLVVIVNHALAEHYWPDQSPIGKRMRFGTPKSKTPWMMVVGEVGDTKLGRLETAMRLDQFYTPVAQTEKDIGSYATPDDLNGAGGYIVVRSALPAQQMKNALLATIRAIDPQLPLAKVQTMDEVVAASEGPRRFNTVVISSFAPAAVLLAVLGIYSVIAFSVASRVQEMAIRMALGSQRSAIMRLILVSGVKLAAIGSVLGLTGAAAASSLLRSFLYHVSPFDPAVMILAAFAVFVLALAASAMPARRAATIDLAQTLRGE